VRCRAPRSWVTQFRVLLRRAMLAQLRNPTDTTTRLFLSTWVGVLAGARARALRAEVGGEMCLRYRQALSLYHATVPALHGCCIFCPAT